MEKSSSRVGGIQERSSRKTSTNSLYTETTATLIMGFFWCPLHWPRILMLLHESVTVRLTFKNSLKMEQTLELFSNSRY